MDLFSLFVFFLHRTSTIIHDYFHFCSELNQNFEKLNSSTQPTFIFDKKYTITFANYAKDFSDQSENKVNRILD